jgi:hypothetical protein
MIKNIFGNKAEFKFQEPSDTACFVCDHVFNNERPILFVSHDKPDGSWQFLCGDDDHHDDSIRIISLKQTTERDSTINDLYEMPIGICTEREKVGGKWEPFKLED